MVMGIATKRIPYTAYVVRNTSRGWISRLSVARLPKCSIAKAVKVGGFTTGIGRAQSMRGEDLNDELMNRDAHGEWICYHSSASETVLSSHELKIILNASCYEVVETSRYNLNPTTFPVFTLARKSEALRDIESTLKAREGSLTLTGRRCSSPGNQVIYDFQMELL